MQELLLLNPAKRRKARKASPKRRRNPSPAQRAARAAFASRARRRRNPVAALPAVRRTVARHSSGRRSNPATYRRRRRNPISFGGGSGYMTLIKDAAIGGAGAVAVDLAMGQINGFLPSTLRRVPGQVGVGDAVKVALTIVLGKLLNRPTRGLSMQAAKGALTVQAHGLIANMLPGTMTLGYSSPAQIANMSARVGPNSMGRYTSARPPLLNRYTPAGTMSPVLSGAATREAMLR